MNKFIRKFPNLITTWQTAAVVFCVIYFLGATIVSVNRFWQYEVFYYDFGIYDHAIWDVSQFRIPTIDHLVVGRTTIFADHFSPTVFFLSLLYRLVPRTELLFVIQSLAVCLSGFILYQISREMKLKNILSFGIMLSYLLFIGVQNAVITDFHEATFSVFPFMLTIWAFLKNKFRLYYLCLILFLGCKESMFTVGIAIGLFILLSSKKNRIHGIITILLSVIWAYLSIKVLIPSLAGGRYQYMSDIPSDPVKIILAFFNHPDKIRTLWYSFENYLFLPLMSPFTWPLIIQDFAVRFVPSNMPLRWSMGMHYSVLTGAILGLATVFSLTLPVQLFRNPKFQNILALALILNSLYLHTRVLRGPVALAYNPAFYQHTKDFKFLNDLVNKIPPGASVMTQNNIAPHFTRTNLFMLEETYGKTRPDYIVIDFREGQNMNNFFPIGDQRTKKMINALERESLYRSLFNNGQQFIFQRSDL